MKKITRRAARAKQSAKTTTNIDAPIPLRPVEQARPTRDYLAAIVHDTCDRLALHHESAPNEFEPGQMIMDDVAALVDVVRLAVRADAENQLHEKDIDRTLWLAERLLKFGRSMEDAKHKIREMRAADGEEAANA